jgi:hypothetical protein
MNLMDYYLSKTYNEKQEQIPWGSLKYREYLYMRAYIQTDIHT